MEQIPSMSSCARSRLLVSPGGPLAYMVALGSVLWSSPTVCPASCVTVFCTSMPQSAWEPVHVSMTANLKAGALPRGALLTSMSASRIWPLCRLEVTSVEAITEEPWLSSQQS
jgi:hypothetical protein